MADRKDTDKEFDTCFENGSFAELMQKMAGLQGVGSLCNFLRQLTLIYHYIHFRLDRPYLARRDWPDILENLKEELEESLRNGGVPEGWLECLFLYGRSERQEARFQEFDPSRGPFSSASRQTIDTAVKRLKEIEIGARQYSGRKQKEAYVAAELGEIHRWAWRNAWEVTRMLEANADVLPSLGGATASIALR